MKVWLVYEKFFQSFDIVADESLTLVRVCASEETAYCLVDDCEKAQTDENISYYYEEHEVME